MQAKVASILALVLAVTPLYADEGDTPEAVEMFERLIQRIPPATDAHDVHKNIGKEFTYVFNGGNAGGVGVQWTPFWIADRLYCVHRVQSQEPTIAVYQIIEPDLESEPFSEIARKTYSQFKTLRKQRGSARVFDLHAAIDHGVKLEPEQLTYRKIYPSEPGKE